MVRNKARGSLPFYRPRGLHGSRIEWLVSASFHSPPSPASFWALVLQLEPTISIYDAVVPSRSDLVLPDLISERGERGALLSQRASDAEADGDGDVMAGQRRGEKHPEAHIVRNATSIRSRPSDCCRQTVCVCSV